MDQSNLKSLDSLLALN